VTVRIGTGLSTHADPRVGAIEAASAAREGLEGSRCSVAVLFAAGGHLADPSATLEGIHEALLPGWVVGCGAGGVLGAGREVEEGTAVAVWAAALAGEVDAFHATASEAEGGLEIGGLPELAGASAAILLADPYSFPTDQLLRGLGDRAPAVPVLGGVSSARTLDGDAALFCGEEVHGGGAVGLRLEAVDVVPCVSQGAAPVGPEMTITAAEGHVIHELAGVPALTKLREVMGDLDTSERALTASGLLVGIALAGGGPDYGHGDFLVRALLGADPDSKAVSVGAQVHAGQVVRLHARDAESAARDLDDALALRRTALGGAAAAGTLLFTCNGRGAAMFGEADHDVAAVQRGLGGAPAAGFFAAGEIGPVGGENFLHGFTATLAIFAA
jgi:small ligand-binding sensory domain FIST